MKGALLASVGWLSAATAAALSAQVAPLVSILPDAAAEMSTRDVSEADRAHQTMNDYATCLVKMRTVAVRKALSGGTDGEQNDSLARLATQDCLGSGQLRMPANLMRGAVYRALYLRDFATPVPPAAISTDATDDANDTALRVFGRCVNGMDPANVRALIMSDAGTITQRRVIAALGPALSRCIRPGDQVHFSRAVLQGVLAEAAYRQATAPSKASK